MDDRYKELIANRIKSGRKAMGLTVEEASKRAGLGTSRWLNWECAARTPKLDMIPTIAAAIGSSAAYIAGFSDHQGESSDSWRYIVANGENPANQAVSNDFLAFNIDQLRKRDLPERDILLVNVRDNSLAPNLTEGDAVLVDRSQVTVDRTGIFAIRDNSGLIWLRWIRPEMTGGFTLYTADKEHFPDQHFDDTQLANLDIVGKYVGHWHWDAA